MYKLMVVAGPNRGTSYAVTDQEVSIGRQRGNVIVLDSAKVSKWHCKLFIDGNEVRVADVGSSNGTFVNGVLAKEKVLKPGDRISVGEFVFELIRQSSRSHRNAPALAGLGDNVLQFPEIQHHAPPPMIPPHDGMMQHHAMVPQSGANALQVSSEAPAFDQEGGLGRPQTVPKDLVGKALYYFDTHVMPFFYEMNFRNEWRYLCVGLIGVMLAANLVISVQPLFESGRKATIREVARRAQFMARQIAERNVTTLASGLETKTDIGSIDREDAVRVAVLTDLTNRILAPSSKFNQYLLAGSEARTAVKARDWFKNGRESGYWEEVDSDTVVAIEPVKVFNQQLAKNVVIAMAIVSIDTTLATASMGEIGLAYSETLILTGALAALVLLILYRLTLRPFQVLNEDIDKVLKGDMNQVTHEFRIEELDQLWDVLNSALQRAQSGNPNFKSGALGDSGAKAIEECLGPLKTIGNAASVGLVACDGERKIVYMNSTFEEISGIRLDSAVGQDIPSVARDQAFGALGADLFDRASPGSEGVSEDFEFSGISYKMIAAVFGTPGGSIKGYILLAVRQT